MFCSYINNQLKSKSGVSPLKDVDGTVCVEDAEKARILLRQFSNVFIPDNDVLPPFKSRTDNSLKQVFFSPEIVYDVLRELPDKLSATPDSLPAYFLKRMCVSLSSPLCFIYQLSMLSGEIPTIWKTAIVSPIFKSGATSDPANYRPISLTSVCCKVMESVIKKCMMSFFLENSLISPVQHGFLARRSTCTQLLETTFEWSVALNNKHCVDSVYIDFSKAFDTVSHSKLLLKLSKYGISGCLLQWIASFLTNRTQKVRVGNELSLPANVTSGTPQGGVLSPLLFLMYINDLPESLGAASCQMYADDAKIYQVFDRRNYDNSLCDSLSALNVWSQTWQLKIAVEKCHVLRIGYKNPNRMLAIGDIVLSEKETVRDLGVIVSKSLKPSSHCSVIAKKALNRGNLILRALRTSHVETLMLAYKVFVRPLLEYCTPVFSPQYVDDANVIERVQRNYIRRVYARNNLHQSIYRLRLKNAEVNLETLELRRAKFDLLMIYKMFHGAVDLSIDRFFMRVQNSHNIRARHTYTIKSLVRSKCRVMQDSFFNRVVSVWNNLPIDCVCAKSVYIFRKKLDQIGESKLLPNRISLLRNDTSENCRVVRCKCRVPNVLL